MNKLNLTWSQFTLLFAFIFLTFSDTIMAQTCPNVTRTVTNAKSTNSNQWDDIGMIMSNLLSGPAEASWLFETGATFQENGDGTAKLTGTMKLFGDATPARRFDVVLNLTGRSYATPSGGAYNNTGVPTTSWYYYPQFTGTLTGKDGLAGSQLSVSLFMHAFQVGIGADQIFDSQEDYTLNGGAAWFSWKIISQPTDASIVLHDYVQGFSEADFAFLLSGTPTPKCNTGGGNTCGASAGTVALKYTTVTLQNGAATIQGQPTADSKIPAGSFSTYVLTQGDNLTIVGANPTNFFTVNSAGTYRVHVLIFDPTTLDLSKIQFGTTTAAQVEAQLIEGGGAICGSLNLTGSKIVVSSGLLPIANNDATTTAVNTSVTITELTNDAVNGTLQQVTIVSQPANGTVGLNTNNQFVYTPTVGFSGTDSFTYTITNENGISNVATVTVTIPALQPTPIANPDATTTPQNTPVTIASLNNDNLNGGTNPVLMIVNNPANGTAQIVNGQFVYTPNAGFSGTDVFTYKIVASNGTSNTTTVTVTVDACTLSFVTSSKPADITLQVACGKTSAVATWTAPTATSTCGTPVITSNYKPGDAFAIGTTTVTYTATLNGQIVTCSFTVTVTGDTQAPVITCPANMSKSPIPNAANCWTSFTWADATATDNCGATVTQVSGPKSGSCISYGVSTVTYKAIDSAGNAATCSFTITINKPVCGTDRNIPGYMFLGSYNGSDYYKYIVTGDPNYATALNLCAAIGGRLPIIKDGGQNSFLAGKLGTGNCWLGLTRSNSKWQCSDGTFQGSYFHWASGEPNNYGGNENCVQMYSSGCWNDVTCTSTNWCVVEIPCGSTVNPCDNDVMPPTIVCPANMTKTPTNNVTCCTSFTWADATVTDNCGTAVCVQTAGPKSGSCIGYGVSTVTYKATDTKGNFATCSFTITVNKPAPVIDPTKCYKIVNKHSGKCLETNGGSYSALANCVQNTYSGNNCQKWNFTPTTNGCFKLQNVQSGKYLACNNNWNGAQVCQNNYENSGQCDWRVELNADGSHTYRNLSCGRVADISGASKDKGASCISYDSKGTDNQKWDIEEVESPRTSNCGWYCYHAQSSKVFEASASAEATRNRVDFTNNLGYEVDYFTVQKLNVATSEFEKIAIINNKTSDNSLQTYSVYDAKPSEGDNFYRVEITNLDGQKSTSELLKANFSKTIGINVYPNPANDYIEVDMKELAGSNVTITLFNQIGVAVMSHTVEKANAGVTEHFDISTLGNGQYLLRVSSKDKRDVTKAIFKN